jgi:hypothetical protein
MSVHSQDDRLSSMINGDVVHERRELFLRKGGSRIDVGREQESINREVGVMSEGYKDQGVSDSQRRRKTGKRRDGTHPNCSRDASLSSGT